MVHIGQVTIIINNAMQQQIYECRVLPEVVVLTIAQKQEILE